MKGIVPCDAEFPAPLGAMCFMCFFRFMVVEQFLLDLLDLLDRQYERPRRGDPGVVP
jgi:hypothetical protein